MQIKPLKTVRFTKLVEESGHPVSVTLWTAPDEDREFSKAMREDRVLTIMQRSVGAKADYGLVGFFKASLAGYLVFPKKLRHPAETKVVGIKYDQLAEEKPRGPLHKSTVERPTGIPHRAPAAPTQTKPAPESPPPKPSPSPVKPTLYRFRANVELTFRQIIPVEVEAQTTKEATQLVKEKMATLEPDPATATLKRHASAPRRLTQR